ncbi:MULTISPECIES: glycosyltransferase family 2 protein [Acidiphilium]|uniref:Glycosyl transferase family 2 n=1 Tax=Acidiphilium rubrum TaxID=526 RepID=A0A8G2FHC3_ACIRU|nr:MULTISPECIES: glycosyltransferase family 2 protein [Acidiphilium]SIR15881.1 Glycosyl transferase family 2 [Acidiphilium rubrum]
MRLVSVTRILNEDDIVEAFVRHNHASLDHMVFLDNGSTDATLDILRQLQAEGLRLSVFQTIAAGFDEVAVNTWLYRMADQMHRADFVVFLDADEFITTTDAPLADLLAARPVQDRAVAVPLVHYFDTVEDDAAELIVPVRLRWRVRVPTGVTKMIVRGGLGTRITIDAGNHGGTLDGRPVPTPRAHTVALAHYPRRSGWHDMQKSAIGWLKVLAAGQATVDQGRSAHYRAPFERMRDAPGTLLVNTGYLAPPVDHEGAILAPITYRGGPLRYTKANDPARKAFMLALHYAEQLARQHGTLQDRSPEARQIVTAWNAERRFLF